MKTNRDSLGQFAKSRRWGVYIVLIVILYAGFVAYKTDYISLKNQVEYIKEEVIVETTPDWAKDQDAVKAAQAVIRKKELETQLGELRNDRAAIVMEYDQKLAEVDAEIAATREELSAY